MTFPFNRAYNRARVKIGLSRNRRPYGSMFDSAWLVLATGCPSLDVPRADLPNQVHFVGRLSPQEQYSLVPRAGIGRPSRTSW
jgi:hypothetical protein